MKLNVVMNALVNYSLFADIDEAEREETRKAIKHCAIVLKKHEKLFGGPANVSLIEDLDLAGVLSMLTYDIYGKLYRMLGGKVPFSCYCSACRTIPDIENFTTSQLYVGYEFIKDLYADNEHYGCNALDGTFAG